MWVVITTEERLREEDNRPQWEKERGSVFELGDQLKDMISGIPAAMFYGDKPMFRRAVLDTVLRIMKIGCDSRLLDMREAERMKVLSIKLPFVNLK